MELTGYETANTKAYLNTKTARLLSVVKGLEAVVYAVLLVSVITFLLKSSRTLTAILQDVSDILQSAVADPVLAQRIDAAISTKNLLLVILLTAGVGFIIVHMVLSIIDGIGLIQLQRYRKCAVLLSTVHRIEMFLILVSMVLIVILVGNLFVFLNGYTAFTVTSLVMLPFFLIGLYLLAVYNREISRNLLVVAKEIKSGMEQEVPTGHLHAICLFFAICSLLWLVVCMFFIDWEETMNTLVRVLQATDVRSLALIVLPYVFSLLLTIKLFATASVYRRFLRQH